MRSGGYVIAGRPPAGCRGRQPESRDGGTRGRVPYTRLREYLPRRLPRTERARWSALKKLPEARRTGPRRPETPAAARSEPPGPVRPSAPAQPGPCPEARTRQSGKRYTPELRRRRCAWCQEWDLRTARPVPGGLEFGTDGRRWNPGAGTRALPLTLQ